MLGKHTDVIRQYSDHVYRAAVEWIVTMKEGLMLMAQKPDSVLGIKYEDYVRDVETRRRVLEFCDLRPDERYEKYCTAVLKFPLRHPDISLPDEINDEFMKVMGQLGYA